MLKWASEPLKNADENYNDIEDEPLRAALKAALQEHFARQDDKMKWTSEPPTEPGWYFMRQGGQVTVCRVVLYCDGLVAMFGAMRQSVDFMKKIGAQWAGPIPEPVEPEE